MKHEHTEDGLSLTWGIENRIIGTFRTQLGRTIFRNIYRSIDADPLFAHAFNEIEETWHGFEAARN